MRSDQQIGKLSPFQICGGIFIVVEVIFMENMKDRLVGRLEAENGSKVRLVTVLKFLPIK